MSQRRLESYWETSFLMDNFNWFFILKPDFHNENYSSNFCTIRSEWFQQLRIRPRSRMQPLKRWETRQYVSSEFKGFRALGFRIRMAQRHGDAIRRLSAFLNQENPIDVEHMESLLRWFDESKIFRRFRLRSRDEIERFSICFRNKEKPRDGDEIISSRWTVDSCNCA